MSEVFIPVPIENHGDRERVVRDLHACGARRIFLAVSERPPFAEGAARDALIDTCRDAIAYYTAQGFEAGLWFSSLGFGTPHTAQNRVLADAFTPIRSILGARGKDALCPTNPAFSEMMQRFVAQLASCHPAFLMLDDELCLSVRPGIGCACEEHLRRFSERVGETVSLERLPQRLFSGAPNRYRSAWLSLMGDTLKEFCAGLRRAVDAVDPAIRMGFAAGYTSWDFEGVDAVSLTRVLAGKTRPFLRLTGAPYWVAYGRFGRQTLATVVETARQQAAWLREHPDVDFFSEIDTYPRNRLFTPRAYSEAFDLATRTAENLDHLKYMYEYSCPSEYERGYVDEHVGHLALYEEIEATFADKTPLGIRIYQTMRKLEGATLPAFPTGEYAETHAHEKALMRIFSFPNAQKLLTPHAIPTVYEGKGLCGIVVGEDARQLPAEALDGGLILDVSAAKILSARGIDVGLCAAEPGEAPALERYLDGSAVPSQIFNGGVCDRICCDPTATVLSVFDDSPECPIAYRYENAKGQRFLVYAFDVAYSPESSGFFWSYGRGIQIANALPWLSGHELPARCHRHPHLYAIAKEGGGALALAYLNLWPDEVRNAEILLDREVSEVRFIHCEGKQTGPRTLVIDRIPAYGFAGVAVK